MLEVHHIFKTYEGKPLLNDISFTVAEGETICLLGASGSGKSTLLRIIAGLEESDSGFVSFNGIDLAATPPHLRDFGLVFQDYALFPHLNVNENVAFGLKMRRLPQAEIAERVANSLEMVNLGGFEKRQVTELSGGEQQRVALARALATRPRLLMFDEPLGALDRSLREDLLNELRTILHRTRIPAIYVTHDQEEAFTIAERVLILHDGEIVRAGTPADVWANPKSVFVAEFLGLGNIIEGIYIGKSEVETRFGKLTVRCDHKHQRGDNVYLLARPLPAGGEGNAMRGVVSDVIFQQDRFKVVLDNSLHVYLPEAPKVGEEIEVRVKVECLA
ncbi:MAG TPA: ABC transporter ATP-binding protein [Anaerolineae bacterium]|nr:ABC transporter ATP-binding protein [Anaerolineales bacterium]HSD83825.1 ABC transporter ATP-binding protein [Anaerolineae bacterium]